MLWIQDISTRMHVLMTFWHLCKSHPSLLTAEVYFLCSTSWSSGFFYFIFSQESMWKGNGTIREIPSSTPMQLIQKLPSGNKWEEERLWNQTNKTCLQFHWWYVFLRHLLPVKIETWLGTKHHQDLTSNCRTQSQG